MSNAKRSRWISMEDANNMLNKDMSRYATGEVGNGDEGVLSYLGNSSGDDHGYVRSPKRSIVLTRLRISHVVLGCAPSSHESSVLTSPFPAQIEPPRSEIS